MRIQDVMTKSPETVRPHHDAAEAVRVMWERDCGVVPVIDDEGAPIAMITDRDICIAAYTRGCTLHDMSVASVMSKGVRSCRPDDSIADAERIMQQAQVRRLPVVDMQGSLVGIVSLGDIARARGRGRIDRAAEHLFAGIAATLAAVSEPSPGHDARERQSRAADARASAPAASIPASR